MGSDIITVLRDLVAFDTTSATSNLALLDHVGDHLGGSWRLTRVHSDDGERANLIAVLGPDVEGGLVLSAHTDCVPVTGQPWTSDPFDLQERDGRVVGRGCTDMKGFLAACLVASRDLDATELRRPLVLALSYDEELGTVGAASLVQRLGELVPAPAAAIVGEPTNLEVVDAHKGVRSYTVEVVGRDGHSARPDQAASAIVGAAELITAVARLGDRDAPGPRDESFDPPRTSVNIGQIQGGQAINIIARGCTFSLEYRPVPGDDDNRILDALLGHARDVVLPRMRATAPDADVRVVENTHAPALARVADNPAIRAAAAAGADASAPATAPYGTDAGHFQRAGIPAVVCGPGSIDQAHQPDEWLEVEQLVRAEEFVRSLVAQLSQDPA